MHGFDSPHLPVNAIAPSEVTINSDTFEVKITFSINVTIPMTVPPGNAEAIKRQGQRKVRPDGLLGVNDRGKPASKHASPTDRRITRSSSAPPNQIIPTPNTNSGPTSTKPSPPLLLPHAEILAAGRLRGR